MEMHMKEILDLGSQGNKLSRDPNFPIFPQSQQLDSKNVRFVYVNTM